MRVPQPLCRLSELDEVECAEPIMTELIRYAGIFEPSHNLRVGL